MLFGFKAKCVIGTLAGELLSIFSPFDDPRTTKAPRGLVYGIPVPFELAPTFFSGFLGIETISADERTQLGRLLGVELTESCCKDLDLQIQRFVAGVALAQQLPSWKDYAGRLKEIAAICDQLLEAARRFHDLIFWKPNDDPPKAGALSLDSSVKHYFYLSGARPEIVVDLSTVPALCADNLKTIQPLASRRGTKQNLNFYLFMQSLFHLAQESGADITLPSGQIKEKFNSSDRPPFFKFVREALDLALQKGRAAIEQSDLPPLEKDEALRRLAHCRKTDGGILGYLNQVRAAAAASEEQSVSEK